MLKLASLGSGSEGNSWLFVAESASAQPDTCVMVDCGFAVKETVLRLNRRGLTPEQVTGIVVTHEHDDHIGGVFKFSRKFGTPVYLTHGTWRAALRSKLSTADYMDTGLVRLIDTGAMFPLGALQIHPFPVPHDAAEPVQLLLQHGGVQAAILTDCGSSTPHLVGMLNQADVLVLESNHCPQRLQRSAYPESLKRRVGGDYGHLSNEVACQILTKLDSGRLKHVIAAHLSKNTNCPDLVHSMWAQALNGRSVTFQIACQEEGVNWVACHLAGSAAQGLQAA